MKHLFTFLLIFSCALYSFSQENIEFQKDNFPDKSEEFKQAKRALTRGNTHFNNQDYELALNNYKKANQFNPNNAILNYNYQNIRLPTAIRV